MRACVRVCMGIALYAQQVNSGDALLMHDQMINALSEPVLFCSSTVPRIGLAGKPGSQGTLKVTAKGQLSSILLQLTIPFRLQPCHFGFKEPRAMQVNTTEVNPSSVRANHHFFLSCFVPLLPATSPSRSGYYCTSPFIKPFQFPLVQLFIRRPAESKY